MTDHGKTFDYDSMKKSVDPLAQEKSNQREKFFKELGIPSIGGILIPGESLYDMLMDPEQRELFISKLKNIAFI